MQYHKLIKNRNKGRSASSEIDNEQDECFGKDDDEDEDDVSEGDGKSSFIDT